MSQKITFTYPMLTPPAWAANELDEDTLMPGGAKINGSLFTAVNGKKYIQSGTLLGRTLIERDAGTGFGPADVLTDDELFLLAFDVTDAVYNDDCELYRHHSVVKENFLPNYGTLTADQKNKLRELYTCTLGAN